MRACWIDHGQVVDTAKLRKHGIDEVYIPTIESPAANKHYMDSLKALGFKVGLFVAWSWFPGINGKQFAEKCHSELLRIGWNGNPKLQVDIEKGAGLSEAKYVDYVYEFMHRWRELRPTRATDWTLEGLQGGLFNGRGDVVQAIIGANVGIIPQHYTGDMRPIAPDVVVKDLWLYGFPPERIKGYYRGEDLPLVAWDGCAWSQGRLK